MRWWLKKCKWLHRPSNKGRHRQHWLDQEREEGTEHREQPERAERNQSQQQCDVPLWLHSRPLCATSLPPLQTLPPETSICLTRQRNSSSIAIPESLSCSSHPFVARIFHTLSDLRCILNHPLVIIIAIMIELKPWVYLTKDNWSKYIWSQLYIKDKYRMKISSDKTKFILIRRHKPPNSIPNSLWVKS